MNNLTEVPKDDITKLANSKILSLRDTNQVKNTNFCPLKTLNSMLGHKQTCPNSIFSGRLKCAVEIFSANQNCLPKYELEGRFLAISHYEQIRIVLASTSLDHYTIK